MIFFPDYKMSLRKEINALKNETRIRKQLIAKSVDRELTHQSFFERSSKLFEPLLESHDKVNDNLKALENNIKEQNIKRQQNVVQQSGELQARPLKNEIPKVKLEPKKTFAEESGGNSWFKQDDEGSYYLANEKAQTPRFKVREGKITFTRENNNYIVDVTPGLNELLFVKDFDTSKINKEDVEQYYRLYGQLTAKEGNSKRAKQIHRLFPSINRDHYIKGGTGLQMNTDKTIPKSKEAVINRIQVLLTSKSFGQENVSAELQNLIKYLSNIK